MKKNNIIYHQKQVKEKEEELKKFHEKIVKAIDATYSKLENYSKEGYSIVIAMKSNKYSECEEMDKIVEKVENKYDVPLRYIDNEDNDYEPYECSCEFYW